VTLSYSRSNGTGDAVESLPVFTEVPELLRGVPPEAAAELVHMRVPVLKARPGPWLAPQTCTECHFGLLVIEGVLVRRISFNRRTAAELLGGGDLIRPWAPQIPLDTIATVIGWHVLEPVIMAVLDSVFARRVARFPQVAAALLERSTERARMLAFQQVASHIPGLEGRLVAMLWGIADRWGRVTSDGVVVPIRLTHATLAELVGASRPSVSSALKLLERGGVLERSGGGWLLRQEPPLALDTSVSVATAA
jgi:CRP/FNR family transcriptional regulator, cyclic AMP receptor protein